MSKATTDEVMGQMATQIATGLTVIPDLVVVGGIRVSAPTPPLIDIFPPDEEDFYEPSGYGGLDYDFVYIVRARVTTADQVEGQKFLHSMMDPNSAQSVVRVLEANRTLSGKAQDLIAGAPTGYGLYADAAHQGGLLGCIWRTVVTV